MEPFTTAALAAGLTALVDGAAGEAGKSAWRSLTSFVRSRLGSGTQPGTALAALAQDPQDQHAAQRLAQSLEDLARTDPTAAVWLEPWFEQLRAITGTTPPATNIIAGDAQVNTAIQGQNFYGDIHL